MAATLAQLPPAVDLEWVAGNPFTMSVACSGAAVTSPVVTMKTLAGDAYTSDPGVPTVSALAGTITSAWSIADSSALNATKRPVEYLWSLQALVNGEGPYELVARKVKVHPVGSAGRTSSSDLSLAITVGGADVTLDITVGSDASNIDGGTATSVYGGTTSIDGGSA